MSRVEQGDAVRWLEVHGQIAQVLARSRSLAEAGEPVLRALAAGLRSDSAVLWRVDGGRLSCVSACPREPATGPQLAERVYKSGRPERASDRLAFPIVSARGVLGVVELEGGLAAGLDPRALTRPVAALLAERMEREEAEARVREQLRYQETLQHLADHDQLTGLLNRRAFEAELKRELARSGRYGSHGAVLSLDVDQFKAINDSAGHAAGDAVLIEVAAQMRERFRASDVLARLGGDEFGALLPNVSPEEARTAAEDLVAGLRSRPAVYGAKPFRITASVGVAPFEPDDATSGELLVNADLAMYAAKQGGRDRVVVYTLTEARSARAMAKLSWSQRIQNALERDRFVLHLQPILELASGQVRHGELLLRMRGERGKLIAPGAFLPAAERFGLIHAIDRWVVQRAIALVAGAEGQDAPRLSINLSGESVVGDAHLLGLIERELARSSIDPSRLIFEITETAAIANMTEAIEFARGLTDLGASLALDDFGTGFGSFYYLKHLPVRYVKMDGEFIHNLPRSPVDEHMVRAIVGVAQGLGIKTVAESVTDDETIRLLHEHGVDYAQGFHVGRPAPVAALS